jgi:hypothetical protein
MGRYPTFTFEPENEDQYRSALNLATTWHAPLRGQLTTDATAATNNGTPAESTGQVAMPTLQQVRTRLTELSRAGKAAEIKALLKQYGASSLTELAPAHYSAVLAAGGAL